MSRKININIHISEKLSNIISSILQIIFLVLIILGIYTFIIEGQYGRVTILVLSDTFRWIAYWNSLIIFGIFGIIMLRKYKLTGIIYITLAYIIFESLAVVIRFNPFTIYNSGLLQYLTWYFTIFFVTIFNKKIKIFRLIIGGLISLGVFQILYFISWGLNMFGFEIIYEIIVIIAIIYSIRHIKTINPMESNPNKPLI